MKIHAKIMTQLRLLPHAFFILHGLVHNTRNEEKSWVPEAKQKLYLLTNQTKKKTWNGKNTIPMCVPIVLYTEVNSREGPASYRWSKKHHRVIDTRRCPAGAITKPGTQQNKHKNPTTNITTHTHTRWVFGLPHTHTKKNIKQFRRRVVFAYRVRRNHTTQAAPNGTRNVATAGTIVLALHFFLS